MTDNQKTMCTGLFICWNTQVAQRWARSQVYLLIHSAGLSLTIAAPQPTFRFLFWTSIGGLILVIFWYLANWRTNQWLVYWQSRLAAFERAEPNPVEIGVFTGPEWERMTRSWFPFHYIVNLLIMFIAVLWFITLVRAFLL